MMGGTTGGGRRRCRGVWRHNLIPHKVGPKWTCDGERPRSPPSQLGPLPPRIRAAQFECTRQKGSILLLRPSNFRPCLPIPVSLSLSEMVRARAPCHAPTLIPLGQRCLWSTTTRLQCRAPWRNPPAPCPPCSPAPVPRPSPAPPHRPPPALESPPRPCPHHPYALDRRPPSCIAATLNPASFLTWLRAAK